MNAVDSASAGGVVTVNRRKAKRIRWVAGILGSSILIALLTVPSRPDIATPERIAAIRNNTRLTEEEKGERLARFVKTGMSYGQVKDLMGEPRVLLETEMSSLLSYELPNGLMMLTFRYGILVEVKVHGQESTMETLRRNLGRLLPTRGHGPEAGKPFTGKPLN